MQSKMCAHYCLLYLATGDADKGALWEEAVNQNRIEFRLRRERGCFSDPWMLQISQVV